MMQPMDAIRTNERKRNSAEWADALNLAESIFRCTLTIFAEFLRMSENVR